MSRLVESVRIDRVLRDTPRRRVLLVEDDHGEKFVLKRYRDPRGASQERAFLRAGRTRPLQVLRLPRIVEEGDDYVILDYVERQSTPDFAGMARAWSPSDIRLWVDGLLEFQDTNLPPHWFSWRQRAAGTLYPVWRTLWLFRRFRQRLPRRLGTLLPGMIAAYAAVRLRFRCVPTHYDLHGANYEFGEAGRMSMLDFELPYYHGDPLFDPWYRLVLSAVAFERWTVQAAILREYVARARDRGYRMIGLEARSRLIALQCTLGCLLYHDDAVEQARHAHNLELLLDARAFRDWLRGVVGTGI